VDEQRLRSAAHDLGASVNDVLLVGVGESLRAVEARAGRSIDPVVVSVPVAVRQAGARIGVGNAVGVMPVSVPTRGPLADRVRQVAAIRRDRLAGDHGRSLPLVLLAFRVLHALRLVGWFENRQRLVNTFVSAIPPLPGPLRIGGAEVGAVVPLVLGQGNTTVAFTSVRYHGRFVVTVATDPDVGPDSTTVVAGLRATLDEITAVGRP
jgi:diacylglycerol O-acyltransferase / wax synthase